MDVDEPSVAHTLLGEVSSSESSQMKQQLSGILRDQTKRKALLKLRGDHAQSWIDGLNYFILHPEIRRSAEPWLLKHSVIILRKLCEVSTLYPTCYVLSDIRDITPKSGGGFCDICQGRFKEQLLCLKVVRIYQDSNISQLLKAHAREAILWSQLDHPNIVPFYGIFYLERKERICLVSPWMENGDIVDYLQRVNDAPREPLVHDIANGLQYLHSQNIVHGDLKGRNVLIDNRHRACLADFGLSTITTNETLSFARTTIGTSGHTTRWASPELLDDYARPTRESDVWAFGCLCYEVFTGFKPFAGCSDISVIAKLLRGQLPARLDNIRLHQNEDLDKRLRNLIGRCWSIEVEQRPQYTEILQELEVEKFFQRPEGHPSIIPDQSWLHAPGNSDILGQFRDLLEQLYHKNGVDDIAYVEDPFSTLELEDQTLGEQYKREMSEGKETLVEEHQKKNEESDTWQKLYAEQERLSIAKEAERVERFKQEQLRVQLMMDEREKRNLIAKEAERKRKSAWAKMATKERHAMLLGRKRDERFKDEQKRLSRRREHQSLLRTYSSPYGSIAWSPESGTSKRHHAEATSRAIVPLKSQRPPLIDPGAHCLGPSSTPAEPKNTEEPTDKSSRRHLPVRQKHHEFFFQAHLYHDDQWEWLLTHKWLYWKYFPWPIRWFPESAEEITVDEVRAYLVRDDFSETPESISLRERIIDHIKKWDPDRFKTQWLPKVVDHQKQMVKEGAENVVKCLEELLLDVRAD